MFADEASFYEKCFRKLLDCIYKHYSISNDYKRVFIVTTHNRPPKMDEFKKYFLMILQLLSLDNLSWKDEIPEHRIDLI